MIELFFGLALAAHAPQVQEVPVPAECRGSFETIDWQACADASGAGTPGYSLAMINLGSRAYVEGDYASALTYYDKAEIPGQTISSDVLFHTFRGDTYRHAGRMDAAREDARWAWLFLRGEPPVETEVRDLRPLDDELRFFVLTVILPILKEADAGEFSEARDLYVSLPVDDWQALSTRANALSLIGEHSAALADSKRAVEQQPDDPMLMNNHCYTLVEAGQAAQGLSWCERATAALPESPPVRHSYAAALAGVGRCADSERQLAEARRLDPSSALYREPIACQAKG